MRLRARINGRRSCSRQEDVDGKWKVAGPEAHCPIVVAMQSHPRLSEIVLYAERTQLLRADLFPSTSRRPRTTATFRLLRMQERLSGHGKLTTYEHYKALERLTDSWGLQIPKVRHHSQSFLARCLCR